MPLCSLEVAGIGTVEVICSTLFSTGDGGARLEPWCETLRRRAFGDCIENLSGDGFNVVKNGSQNWLGTRARLPSHHRIDLPSTFHLAPSVLLHIKYPAQPRHPPPLIRAGTIDGLGGSCRYMYGRKPLLHSMNPTSHWEVAMGHPYPRSQRLPCPTPGPWRPPASGRWWIDSG